MEKINLFLMDMSDIFVDKDTNEWTSNEQCDINMHKYMHKYDLDIIDSALNEYRNDFK